MIIEIYGFYYHIEIAATTVTTIIITLLYHSTTIDTDSAMTEE